MTLLRTRLVVSRTRSGGTRAGYNVWPRGAPQSGTQDLILKLRRQNDGHSHSSNRIEHFPRIAQAVFSKIQDDFVAPKPEITTALLCHRESCQREFRQVQVESQDGGDELSSEGQKIPIGSRPYLSTSNDLHSFGT